MTSSTSCSDKQSRGVALVMAALLAGVGCASAPAGRVATTNRKLRVLVLPVENLSATSVPAKSLLDAAERALALRGVEVVSGAPLEEFMARHRMRYTGGLDRALATAAREELGVDGVLVTSVELFDRQAVRFAVSMRLVEASEEATILWMDGVSRSGDDNPGLLGTGIIRDFETLQASALGQLADSLIAFLDRGQLPDPCDAGAAHKPRVAFRSAPVNPGTSVVVLPFVNHTPRRGAGEVVAVQVTKQFVAAGFRTLEPGVVRDQLLRFRVVMEAGVSTDQARLMMNSLSADLVVTGYVFTYEDQRGSPAASVKVMVLERASGQVVWESTSSNRGTDSMTLFGLGQVRTAPLLVCKMVHDVIEVLEGETAMPPRR